MGFIFWLSIAQTGMTSCFALVTAPCTHLFSLCPNRTQLKHRRYSEKNRRGFSRVPYTGQASPQYDSLHPNMQWGPLWLNQWHSLLSLPASGWFHFNHFCRAVIRFSIPHSSSILTKSTLILGNLFSVGSTSPFNMFPPPRVCTFGQHEPQ